MGFFSLFRKQDPEEVIASLCQDIVAATILAPSVLAVEKDQRSQWAWTEVLYLLLHLVDRELFALMGQQGRDRYLDRIVLRAIGVYAVSEMMHRTPNIDTEVVCKEMLNTFNLRQMSYSNCTSLFGEGSSVAGSITFPRPGSMVFALCLFVHEGLGRPTPKDANNLLAGKGDISSINLTELPDVECLMRAAVYIGTTIKELRLQANLKHLR